MGLDQSCLRSRWNKGGCTCFDGATYGLIIVAFVVLLIASALQSFDPGDRFAFRTRVNSMVEDEYLLEGKYPGSLMMASTYRELYEWMEGPIAGWGWWVGVRRAKVEGAQV